MFPPLEITVIILRCQLCLAHRSGIWGRQCPHRGLLSGGGESSEGLPQLHLSHSAPSRSGRADLAAIYHERIDVEGHHYGPSSPQRKDALKAVDTVLKYMTKWIQVTETKDHEADLPSCHFLSVSLAVITLQHFPSYWC